MLRHTAATRDCRLALSFVESMRPCLRERRLDAVDAVLDDCARVLSGLPPEHAGLPAVRHTEAMLRLFRGDPAGAADLARRARAGTTNRRDRALVDATIAVALAEAGDLGQAREYARRVPPSCPFHQAACRATLADGLPRSAGLRRGQV